MTQERVTPAAAAGTTDHAGHHDHYAHHVPHQGRSSPSVATAPQLRPKSADVAAPSGTVYVCPMHPQIRRDAPGNCPICGMALEPEMPSLDEQENPELVDFTRRFRWTLPMMLAGVVLAMGGHRFVPLAPEAMPWLELVLATPVVLWAGLPFFVRCWQSIVNRSPNMWTLIGLGVAAAYVYSVLATLVPGIFPDAFRTAGRVGVYFEAAAVIVSLTLLGQVLELRARSQTSAAIRAPARPAAEDGAPDRPRWHRGGRAVGQRACRRRAPRAPRREGAGRRRGHRRPLERG